ncbi:hypothetical protein AVEN_83426-1, partial [Araneus ventricosus]
MATVQQKAHLACLWFYESKSVLTVQRIIWLEYRNCRSPSDEVCDFVWQYEQRRRWITYTVEDIQFINKTVREKLTSVLLPSKNSRKQFIIDLEKMVQRNKVSLYEQRIRCLVTNSGCSVWLWKDSHEDWHCFKPYLTFYLEIAFQRNDKIFRFHDQCDYEVNFETWLQTNEETLNTNAVKRENVEFAVPTELKNLCDDNETLLKRVCSSDIPSAKRIKIDSRDDKNRSINISTSAFNPLNLADSMNTEQTETSPSSNRIVPVDSECPERENFHIYCEGNTTKRRGLQYGVVGDAVGHGILDSKYTERKPVELGPDKE